MLQMTVQNLVDARFAYLHQLRIVSVHQLDLFSFSNRAVASVLQLNFRSSIAVLDLSIFNSQYLELMKVHRRSYIEAYDICTVSVAASSPLERYTQRLSNGYNMGYPGWPSASSHCDSTFLSTKLVISVLTLEYLPFFTKTAKKCYKHTILLFTSKTFLKQPLEKALEFKVVEKIMFLVERLDMLVKRMLILTSQRSKNESEYPIISHRSRGNIVRCVPKKLETCCLLAPLSGSLSKVLQHQIREQLAEIIKQECFC